MRTTAFAVCTFFPGFAEGFSLLPPSSTPSNIRSQFSCLYAETTGPKAAGRQRPPSSRSRGDRVGSDSTTVRRSPRERKTASSENLFDGKALTAAQLDQEKTAPALNLKEQLSDRDDFRCMADGDLKYGDEIENQPPFQFHSLDDLFGTELGFSETFNTDTQFRQDLRMAIRQDIFDTTPLYENLSEKAASFLLLPDSSLEGSWRMPESMDRMQLTTQVLKSKLGEKGPTGDEFMKSIGELCGMKPSTHFIDIFGVQDRKINHSWHLDCGRSPDDSRTVLLGFPPEDNYDGCGVFSHIISLQSECLAPMGHARNEPILFSGTTGDEYIVRPRYGPGREIISYRDVDVLHSAPDVTYRTSIMRFM